MAMCVCLCLHGFRVGSCAFVRRGWLVDNDCVADPRGPVVTSPPLLCQVSRGRPRLSARRCSAAWPPSPRTSCSEADAMEMVAEAEAEDCSDEGGGDPGPTGRSLNKGALLLGPVLSPSELSNTCAARRAKLWIAYACRTHHALHIYYRVCHRTAYQPEGLLRRHALLACGGGPPGAVHGRCAFRGRSRPEAGRSYRACTHARNHLLPSNLTSLPFHTRRRQAS